MSSINLTQDQFQQLLKAIADSAAPPPSSFADAKFSYSGECDSTCVRVFLATATCYKEITNMTDQVALQSLPLILKDDAAEWWNSVSETITTWDGFQNRLRRAFAPAKPAYILYQEIILGHQGDNELTETFIAKKRDLFSQLPEPHYQESQKLDMIYGALNKKIRDKVPRESVLTFNALLDAAQHFEQLFLEEQATKNKKRVRCNFCRIKGHTQDECRKKDAGATNSMELLPPATDISQAVTSTTSTQAPSPSQPSFSCYGCGAPGVVRSKCVPCTEARRNTGISGQRLDFCAGSVENSLDIRMRPVVDIGIESIVETAYVDTCAKSSVASHKLYESLKELGYPFIRERAVITLADGVERSEDILKVQCDVNISGRSVPTKFIVFPGKTDTKTLLGVGFIQDSGMILDFAHMTWYFIDKPMEIFDLKEECAYM